MTAPSVRPAVAAYWNTAPVTCVDGLPDQIAARAREALLTMCQHYTDPGCDCLSCSERTARVLAALGITTEARDV